MAFLGVGLLFAVVAIAGLSAVGWVANVASSAPPIDQLKARDPGETTLILDANGHRLGPVQADILRQEVPSSSIPDVMREATVAIEDKRFYKHKGVDYEGIVRAAAKNVEADGSTVQGGSTLTQQLIKNLYTNDRTRSGIEGYKRKIREAKLATELEDAHPGAAGKLWILTKYLNTVPYGTVGGQEAVGVQAAARVYFNKRAADLTMSEAALLAGLPQGPSLYSPLRSPDAARKRRAQVLDAMASMRYITTQQAESAKSKPLDLQKSTYYSSRREGYVFDYVRKQLVAKYGQDTVQKGGLKVYTTIDPAKQQEARASMQQYLGAPGMPSSAIVSMDPDNGHIEAMATTQNYGDSKFNLATQGKRQPGSTFKIVVLMTALRMGVDINKTSYVSKYLNFNWTDPTSGSNFKIDVHTSEGNESNKPKSIFEGVVSSDNTVFTQLALDVGLRNIIETARMMGISSPLEPYPSIALGAFPVSPLEMTRAYASINNGGYRVKPVIITKVVFPDGRVDRSLGRAQRKKIFTDGQTIEAIKAMQANVARGTGTNAQLPNCVPAGKTGTTNDFTDAWFDGMTHGLNTAVWVGYPKSTLSMTAVPGYGEMFGGDAPAQIWASYMKQATSKATCGQWPAPKVPFVSSPFAGKYSKSAPPSSTDPDDPTAMTATGATGGVTTTPGAAPPATDAAGDTADAAATTGGGDDGGDTQYPPDQYATPPDGPAAGDASPAGTAGAAQAPTG